MSRWSEHRNSALAPTNIVCPEHGRPSTLPKLSKEDEASFKSGKVKGKLVGSLSHMVPLKSAPASTDAFAVVDHRASEPLLSSFSSSPGAETAPVVAAASTEAGPVEDAPASKVELRIVDDRVEVSRFYLFRSPFLSTRLLRSCASYSSSRSPCSPSARSGGFHLACLQCSPSTRSALELACPARRPSARSAFVSLAYACLQLAPLSSHLPY